MDAARIATAIVGIACGACAVWFARLALALLRLSADVAAKIGTSPGPADDPATVAPFWIGAALALAAVGGALVGHAARSRRSAKRDRSFSGG